MIRYAYFAQMQPPAPFVHVLLRNPVSAVELRDVPAQLDTAADRTVVPESLVKSLALPQVGTIRVGSFGGGTHLLPVFAAQLGLHDLPIQPIKVAAHAEESWVLLGRDVLNSYRVVLDGPQLALEINR
jgi:hypothetical protein